MFSRATHHRTAERSEQRSGRCDQQARHVAFDAEDLIEIQMLASRLAQASDDCDEKAYRECLADFVTTVNQRGNVMEMPADEYASGCVARVAAMDWTHHQLGNAVIEPGLVSGTASARIDVVVHVAVRDRVGTEIRRIMGGRYELGLIRTKDGWRIARRTLQRRYEFPAR